MRPDIYDPWTHLRDTYPHIRVTYVDDLPPGTLGETDGHTTIKLRRRLTQVERRSTLAHELVHIERGHDGHCNPTIERDVDRTAAERLLHLEHLLDAAQWTLHLHELAAELWVMPDDVQARLDHLSGHEIIALGRAAHGRDPKEHPWPSAANAP